MAIRFWSHSQSTNFQPKTSLIDIILTVHAWGDILNFTGFS